MTKEAWNLMNKLNTQHSLDAVREYARMEVGEILSECSKELDGTLGRGTSVKHPEAVATLALAVVQKMILIHAVVKGDTK